MAGEDVAYTNWLQNRRWCSACRAKPPSNVHHRTGAGMGLRAHDREGIPLCGSGTTGCHGSLHSRMFGFFEGWNKDSVRMWQAGEVDLLREEYLALGEPQDEAEGVF